MCSNTEILMTNTILNTIKIHMKNIQIEVILSVLCDKTCSCKYGWSFHGKVGDHHI